MKARSVFAVCIGLRAGVACVGQTPKQQSVETQLRGPFLMLRGMYDGHALEFGADGKLEGKAGRLPFGLGALRVNGIRVTDSEVEIDATRAGLVFPPNDSGEVEIYILRPAGMGLDEVPVEYVRHHRFQPAMVNGTGIPIIISIRVDFRLQ